ncbi:protein phosphatase 2C domain-containing protein [Planococcus sp. CAU13]|uniref:protein phosphatase 2C domain-containing protein n=1 Tax=Planococcus sp. CAU13 TaxID=1541197 RepID=UPI0009DD4F85|nr:protein phosphatase 2C domain-containing protein [Planococcus sp. CAU13]
MEEFDWVGSEEHFVDQPDLWKMRKMTVGRFGGNSAAGQTKNEDACLAWENAEEDWEFAMIMDAHDTAESAEVVMEQVLAHQEEIKGFLKMDVSFEFFQSLEALLLRIFRQKDFLATCREIQGETACLIAIRKGKHLYWFSVGDCLLYLFHPELAAMGQYQLNQRHFYEWIGRNNSFDQPVPSFSSGLRELRQGANQILLATDGLTECPGEPYSEAVDIYREFEGGNEETGLLNLLATVQEKGVRDSVTVISWTVEIAERPLYASNQQTVTKEDSWHAE